MKKYDRSDYIASLTSLNGVLNGTPSSYFLDLSEKTLKVEMDGPESTWLSRIYHKLIKALFIIQNWNAPYMTMQRLQDNILKVI